MSSLLIWKLDEKAVRWEQGAWGKASFIANCPFPLFIFNFQLSIFKDPLSLVHFQLSIVN
jgi:hypothetical protein